MSCYDASEGTVWRLNRYGSDYVYMLLDCYTTEPWKIRFVLDLVAGRVTIGFSKGSAFDDEAMRIA